MATMALVAAAVVCSPALAAAAPWGTGSDYGNGTMTGPAVMVTDLQGGTIATWTDRQGGGDALVVRRDGADGTPGPLETLEQPGVVFSTPLIAATRAGAVLTWFDIRNDKADERYVRIHGDGTAGPILTLAAATDQQSLPAIAADAEGDALVAWSERVAGNNRAVVQRIGADDSLAPPVTLTNLNNTARLGLSVALAPDGTGRLLYGAQDISGDWLAAVRLNAAGALDGPGVALSDPGDVSEDVTLGASAGGVVATWGREHAGDPDTIDLRAVRLPSAGPVAGPPIAVAQDVPATSAANASTAVDSDGTLVVALAQASQLRIGRSRPGETTTTFAPFPSTDRIGYAQLAAGVDGSTALTYEYLSALGLSVYVTGQLISPTGDLGPRLDPQLVSFVATAQGIPAVFSGTDGQGGMTVGWLRPNTSGVGEFSLRTAFLDATPPTLDVQVPASAVAGTPVALGATAADAHGLGALTWDLGDGGVATGATATHTYAAAGTYTVRATVADRAGNETTVSRTVTVAAAASAPGGGGAVPVPVPVATRHAAGLKLLKVTRSGRTVKLSGTIDRRASGRLTVTLVVRRGRTTLRTRSTALIAKGRFSATLKLGRALAAVHRTGTLTVAYAGDADTAAATITHSVKVPTTRRKP